tara:strand:- start:18161 stop:18628 length:468 start_codon:yes stop_codon:yes gene_type:complete
MTTTKKRRQRGSRTHGGGTHKNRRGAGNRGGRGNAGRNKHHIHLHPPLGKHGFTRPTSTRKGRSILPLNIQEIEERLPSLVETGVAEKTKEGFRVTARDLFDNICESDSVKILSSGQTSYTFEIIADAFSKNAVNQIEAAGGIAIYTNNPNIEEE